jgi:hypothetical protein
MINKSQIKVEAIPLEMWAGHLDRHLQFPTVQMVMQQTQKVT